jgi:hypothetical protein
LGSPIALLKSRSFFDLLAEEMPEISRKRLMLRGLASLQVLGKNFVLNGASLRSSAVPRPRQASGAMAVVALGVGIRSAKSSRHRAGAAFYFHRSVIWRHW